MKKKDFPTLCLDQHIEADLAAAFRSYFRVLEVSKSRKYRGRDEKEFLPELYIENAVFVTSDEAFVDYVLDNHIKHAGLVYIPVDWHQDEKILLVHLVAGYIQGASDFSRFELRNTVLYPGDDGLHSIIASTDKLEISWDHVFEDF
jgi:hypothetical protein